MLGRSLRVPRVFRLQDRRITMGEMVGRRPGAQTDLDSWQRAHRNEVRRGAMASDHTRNGAATRRFESESPLSPEPIQTSRRLRIGGQGMPESDIPRL